MQKARESAAWMSAIRRHLHRHPELGYQEHATAAFIEEKLAELGITRVKRMMATGVAAWLGKEGATPTVALRADIDALAVHEQTGLPFASASPGIMHACGHDGHVAMLLGAARLLKDCELPGQVALLFQPAEEADGGAQGLIAEGALEGAGMIFGGHIERLYPVGQIAVQEGIICAYTDEFRLTVTGKGGHAAKPHDSRDSIVAASALVAQLQTLISRETDPVAPAVITIGTIQGGTAANAIAEETVLTGTVRSVDPATRATLFNGLRRMAAALEGLYQVSTTVTIGNGYPPVVNDAAASRIAREAAVAVVGEAGVIPQPKPSLGGEDFSFYLEKVPGCFVRFGARKEGHEEESAHSPRFDFDEGVLPIGAAFLARAALTALHHLDERAAGRPQAEANRPSPR
ncbi:MAG: M20 metallopeptidase family protein [Thermodesulfobacteriota bacterium]